MCDDEGEPRSIDDGCISGRLGSGVTRSRIVSGELRRAGGGGGVCVIPWCW